MSKRRKKKIEHKVEHEEKPREEPKTEKTEKAKTSEKSKKAPRCSKNKLYASFAVVAIIFFAAGFFIGPSMSGSAISVSGDQFIFISPDGCSNCDEMEPIVKETASKLNLPFVKTGFGQQLTTPGFVLVHDNILTISGAPDEYTLKNQICTLTENTEICDDAKELEPPAPEQPPPPEVPKSDKPEVHAFVMSYCPYGLQFLKAYVPVMELLGDKADIEINFVHYLMHGAKERDENTRMYCVQKEQGDKLTDYLRCFVKEGDYEGCITEVGLDSDMLNTCMQTADEEFDIIKTFDESQDQFPAYMVDSVLAQTYDVRGSPTFGINGQQIQVSRSPEAIKQAICAAFNSPPEECSQTLSSTGESPGLGPIGSGDGAAGSDAQC